MRGLVKRRFHPAHLLSRFRCRLFKSILEKPELILIHGLRESLMWVLLRMLGFRRLHCLQHFAWRGRCQEPSIHRVSRVILHELLDCLFNLSFTRIVNGRPFVDRAMLTELFLAVEEFLEISKHLGLV